MKIINQLFILIFLLTVSTSMMAQTVSLGPKVGFINSGFSGEDANDVKRRSGASIGGFFNISPGVGIFSLQPELLFTQKGAKRDLPLNIEEELKINYLELPILFKVGFPIDEVFFPNVFAGPYSSLKLSESHTLTQTDTGTEIESSKKYRTADFGGVFGLGFDIKSEKIFFTTDVRYHLGATQIEKADEPDELRNGSFSLNIGVGFRLNGGY